MAVGKIVSGRGHGNVDFAGQVGQFWVARPVVGHHVVDGLAQGAAVHVLVRVDARNRAASEVAHVVHACALLVYSITASCTHDLPDMTDERPTRCRPKNTVSIASAGMPRSWMLARVVMSAQPSSP